MRSPSLPCRVLVTRPAAAASPWMDGLAAAGFAPILYPTIEVRPTPPQAAAREAIAGLSGYAWMVFTSAAAVRAFAALLPDGSRGEMPRIAVVGEETARVVRSLGFCVDRSPEDQRQEGLVAILNDLSPGTRVLFPQAEAGRPDLAQHLRQRGCVVDVVVVTRTRALASLPPLPEFDVATFASPSAVDAFVAAHGNTALRASAVVAIGPTTAAALHAHGISSVTANEPSINGLVSAVARLQESAQIQ